MSDYASNGRCKMETLLILAVMALLFVLGMWWYLSHQQR